VSFLNPILLAGLAAVSVPIVIHLLNRRKFQKVVWAAMRFVRLSVEKNRRRLQFEDLILLALRCLLLALLALALARPVSSRLAKTLFGAQVTAILILDNSYSMGMSDGTSTRFERAKKAAAQSLESMPAGSSVALLLASDVVRAAIPEPTFDLSLARRMIREAPLVDRGTDLAPAIQQAIDTLQRRLVLRGEIYVFTDGQAQGWRQLAQIQRKLEQVREKIRAHVLFVGNNEEANVAVSDLALGSGLVPLRQPVRFRARVTNFGREEARDLRVVLNVDSEPPCDEFSIEVLPPGASREVTFFARFRTEGPHAVTARVNEDRLPADDRRTLVARALRDTRVLLIDGEPGAEPRDSETFFLRHALRPVPESEAPGYFIKPFVISAAEAGGARFGEYDAVILANVAELPEACVRSLEDYLAQGGGVIVFLGGRVNPAFYNEVLARKWNLLPATLGAAYGQADQEEKFFALQDRNLDHPVVSLWNDPGSGTLASARFYRAFELVPAAAGAPSTHDTSAASDRPARPAPGEPRVIARFADGKPALMERDYGLGRLAVFASTADTAWNDLPVRLSFVPLMHRLLGAVAQREDEALNVRVGERFARRAPPDWLGREVTAAPPSSAGGASPESRRVEMRDGWPAVQYDRTDWGGLYQLDVRGIDPPAVLRFAAQPDSAESQLEELPEEQRRLLSGTVRLSQWSPQFTWKAQVERERQGAEFWLPLLVAALATAVMEMGLAQWFSRSR